MTPPKITLNEIRIVASKGSTEPFLTSMYFIRYFSPFLSAVLVKIGLSANVVTTISLIFAIGGSIMHVSTDLFYPLMGTIILLAYNILDHVDGEVARVNYHFYGISSGLGGGYFDALVHYFYTPVLFFAIGLSYFHETGSEWGLWAGLICGMWLSSYGQSASYRVIMDKIVKTGVIPEQFKGVYNHDKVEWKESSLKAKLKFVVREFFSNQGQIFTLLACSGLDYLLVPDLSIRYYYLFFMSFVGCIQLVRISYKFFAILKLIK